MAEAGNSPIYGSSDLVGTYRISGPPRDNPSYCDYDAVHGVMGNGVLLRHEKWTSTVVEDFDGDRLFADRLVTALRRARRLQAEIRHPRILKLLDFFEAERGWISVFERPMGRTIAAYAESIRNGQYRPLLVNEYARICAGLSDALAAVHRAGFVHRTLSSRNVVVSEDHEPTMTDLGCATPIGDTDELQIVARQVLNPSTAAPEHFNFQLEFTPATDMWALGAILYTLRYLRPPYALPDAPTMPLGLRAGKVPLWFPPSGARAPVASADTASGDTRASFDDDEERLVRPWLARLLERDPARRYQNALEAQRDLEAVVTQLDQRPPLACAFVAMPFAPAFDPLWRLIVSASLGARVRAVRIDQSVTNESIWDEIRDQLERADLMIAVASPHDGGMPNANVMLEIGYMRALRRPILVLTSDPDTLPFDLRTQRAICYAPGAENEPMLHGRLRETLQGLVARLPGG